MSAWLRDWGPLLIALGGGSGLTAVLLVPSQIRRLRSQGRLTDAQATHVITKAWADMLQPARTEIARLSKAVEDLENELRAAEAEAETLRGQLSLMSKELADAYAEIERLRTGTGR